eukprot:TRINITY_DN3696_c0_g1_i10.p1 TRINITY_DN3696_c0_g1~~TRINITY_DN3696_c0_g1_i10.p1  ORF type:complete len:149 (-),score=1.49 TRINITY_DN3696_c0_g1_i10:100-546(-)
MTNISAMSYVLRNSAFRLSVSTFSCFALRHRFSYRSNECSSNSLFHCLLFLEFSELSVTICCRGDLQADDEIFLFLGEVSSLNVWSEIVHPPQSATLAASVQSCIKRHASPVTLAMATNVFSEDLIFFATPRPSFQPGLGAARCSSHS